MDEYTRKGSGGGLGFSKRGSSITLRDTNDEGKGIQYCNRSGCNTRLNSMKCTRINSPEKPKFSKASFHTSSSKYFAGSSSKVFSSPTDFRKFCQEKHTRTPLRHTVESSITQRVAEDIKLSSQQVESDASETTAKTTTIQTVLPETEGPEFPDLQELSTIQSEASTSRPRKQIHHQLGPSSQDTASSSSSTRRSVAPRSTGYITRPCSYLGSGPPRNGLKNLTCSSISDILPSGCSSSNLINSRKVTSVRNRPSNGESSSSGGKNMGGSSISSLSASSGSLMQQQGFRRAKSQPTGKDGPVSVRTRRAPVGDSRARLPQQQNEDSVSISEPIVYPQLPHSQVSTLEPVPESSSRSFPMEARPVFHSSFGGRPSSSDRSATWSRLLSSHPADSRRHGVSRDGDEYRRFNMEGIAEVLLVLERIEQDDELTYEQLMVLETNLFFGGFSLNDQHRDMRLDIDNMTYESKPIRSKIVMVKNKVLNGTIEAVHLLVIECYISKELLALEEKMGTVSTALPEEAFSKCLKKSIYIPLSRFPGITSCGDDDTKCSICQEDYVTGEELANLACDHRYHVDCIYQWLRQKNWCPICKASAASPSERKN